MRKAFCVSVCLLMALTAFVGCQSPTSAPTQAPTSAPEQTAAPETTPEPMEAPALPLSAEKVTLSFWTHQGTNSAMAPPSNELPLYQYLESLTNVHIEWQTAPYDTYKDVMNTRISSETLPDILNLNSLGNYETLAAENVIIPQNDLIEQYGINLKKFFADNPAYKKLMTSPDGNIYCIEDTVLDSDLPIEIMINKYALERAGIAAMPTTVDEFYNMLVAFRDKDINGNGQPDEIPLVTDYGLGVNGGTLPALGSAFGLEINWDWNKYFTVQDGKVVSNYSLPAYKDYIAFLNKLYTENLMNKDFATITYDQMIENVSKGTCGAVGFWATYAYLFGDASPDSAPFDAEKKGEQVPIYVPMDPLTAPDGSRFMLKRSGLNGDGMGITVDCAEDKRPIAMKWIDFLFAAPESLECQYNGVPGLTYNKGADGSIVKLAPPEGMTWDQWVTSVGGNQPPRAHQQLIEAWKNTWLPTWLADVDAHQKQFFRDGKILPVKFTKDEEDSISAVKTDLDTYIDENLMAFITGTKPMSDFDTFAASLGSHGLDAVQKAYESRYARQIAD